MKQVLHKCVVWVMVAMLVRKEGTSNTFVATAFQPSFSVPKLSSPPPPTTTTCRTFVGRERGSSWSLRAEAGTGEDAIDGDDLASAPAPAAVSFLDIAGLDAPAKRLTPPPTTDDYDKVAIRAQVQKYIDTETILMFATSTCRFCDRVNHLFKEKVGSDQFKIVYITDRPDMRAELTVILGGGRTSVPAVFIGGEFVGGANDGGLGGVIPLNESGELDGLLSRAGVNVL